METTTSRFFDKAINGLKQAAVELEEFRLQLALGKAESSDKYEELKKQFKETMHETKLKLNDDKVTNEFKKIFDELHLQLTLGKAETKEVFNTQKEKLFKTIQELENFLNKKEIGSEFYLKLNSEIEKFKIKMEILRLQFELGKREVKDNLDEKKADFEKEIDRMKVKFLEKESIIEKNWDQFRNELRNVYSSLKKKFTSK